MVFLFSLLFDVLLFAFGAKTFEGFFNETNGQSRDFLEFQRSEAECFLERGQFSRRKCRFWEFMWKKKGDRLSGRRILLRRRA